MAKFLGQDTNLIDLDALVRLLPGNEGKGWLGWMSRTRGRYIKALLNSGDVLKEAGIDTPVRVGHFIGQGLIETNWLRADEENLTYTTAERIRKVFPSRYKENPKLAEEHVRNPEGLANHVYGGRMGNNEPGDGYKFRGRGFIQLTGRNNYTKIAAASGLPLVDDPDLIRRDLGKSIEAAAAFWQINELNQWADKNDIAAVSRAINYGEPRASKRAHGEDDRVFWTFTALGLLKAPSAILTEDPNKPLVVGARGDRVRDLQQKLLLLGLDFVGAADGIFGANTRRGVVIAQEMLGLRVTGEADTATLQAIEEALEDPRASQTATVLMT